MIQPGAMSVEAVGSPTRFLRSTDRFRATEPVLTNLLATVAAGVAAGRRYERCRWWVVRDGTEVVGCAGRTAPHPLLVSPMPREATTALAAEVARTEPDLCGVTGPLPEVHDLLDALAPARARRTRMDELVKVLGTYVPPPQVPGRARCAVASDEGRLTDWYGQFLHDSGQVGRDPGGSVRALLANDAAWWWEVDGRAVSMAGHGLVVDGIGRIGPVFTPEPDRRQGYGAAVTGAVVAALQPRCSTILMFADAGNATSNGVYERLGFATVAQFAEVELM